MTRKECLDMATQCVLQDRASQYGGMEDNFGRIANFWSVYLGRKVYPADVAAMMALLKIARLRANPGHDDSWVDLAGYAACGAECVRRPAKAEEEGVRVETHWPDFVKAKQAEGCEEPAYNPDNDVVGGVVTLAWPRGKVLEKLYASGRVEKCAEGCEELVQKDAPQTPAELCRHIVDCNPATYGHPHKPTGEELAEMAREDA